MCYCDVSGSRNIRLIFLIIFHVSPIHHLYDIELELKTVHVITGITASDLFYFLVSPIHLLYLIVLELKTVHVTIGVAASYLH